MACRKPPAVSVDDRIRAEKEARARASALDARPLTPEEIERHRLDAMGVRGRTHAKLARAILAGLP